MSRKRVLEDRVLTSAEKQERYRKREETINKFYEELTGLSRKDVSTLLNIASDILKEKEYEKK